MKCTILHETRGRMRVHTMQGAMSLQQADILEAYLDRVSGVTKATVYDRTGDAVICYDGPRETVTKALSSFAYAKEQALAPEHSSRALNRDFEDKLVASLCWRGIKQLFVPSSVRTLITVARSVPYIKAGLTCLMHRKIQVPVLDATAITVSMLRKDFKTASSIMFLLGIGDILDEWTHKKSVADLAGAMALNVDQVWVKAGETEVPILRIQNGQHASHPVCGYLQYVKHPQRHTLAILIKEKLNLNGGHVVAAVGDDDNILAAAERAFVLILDAFGLHGVDKLPGRCEHTRFLLDFLCPGAVIFACILFFCGPLVKNSLPGTVTGSVSSQQGGGNGRNLSGPVSGA